MAKTAQDYIESLKKKNAAEPEFIQAATEVITSLAPVFEKHPEYEAAGIIDRIVEPERIVSFRVAWTDDSGKVQVNRGYRVQFNAAIGPYKGGLRFAPSVYQGMLKFLGFEQIFKNSLTGLPIGGAKGGSDFDPKGKSDAEVMRFCQAFMSELYKYIGPEIDVPAGDLGVGGREIGYLYGQYRRLTTRYDSGVLTGKGLLYGGLPGRSEATGYGLVFFIENMLKHNNDSFAGKTAVISGYGNVAWGTAEMFLKKGAKVITISGSDGYILDEEGLTQEKVDYMLELRKASKGCKGYVDKYPNAKFFPGEKPWGIKADICCPCATQNEVTLEDAKKIVASGCKYYAEGANMPATNEALAYLSENGVIVGPAKAANAGGVACSAIEMSQNARKMPMTKDEVIKMLENIMKNIHDSAAAASAEYGLGYNLIAGANIAGFTKVADAMLQQGLF